MLKTSHIGYIQHLYLIKLDGIHLTGPYSDELHKLARGFTVSKSWYRIEDNCYDIICPITLENIQEFLHKNQK